MFKCEVATDSPSSIGTSSRRGAGRLRHIETPLLWVQHVVARRQLSLRKVPGIYNPADMCTMILERPTVVSLMALAGLIGSSGRHADALRASLE